MAKNLQDRMNDMKPYFKGIEMYNDALIVKMLFPKNWRVYNSSDDIVKVTKSENLENEYFFYGNSNYTTYEGIFDHIDVIIKENKEISLKLQLLKEKAEELKELFSTHSYEELLSLKFSLQEKKKSTAKKRPQKGKKAEEEPKMAENEASAEMNVETETREEGE